MKILHVWDQAGVSYVLAKYQRAICGHDVEVLKRNGFDPFDIAGFYGAVDGACLSRFGFFLTL